MKKVLLLNGGKQFAHSDGRYNTTLHDTALAVLDRGGIDVKEIDGKRVYGHMDYGKKDPSLGWRFTDAWFSVAGGGDKGLPNGLPVDEWGIHIDLGAATGSAFGVSHQRQGCTQQQAGEGREQVHQLPISARPESREALAALGIDTFDAQLWLGGYLLYPWPGLTDPPQGAHHQHLRGSWLHQKDWQSSS